MTKNEARKIIGNQPKWVLSNMCKALQLMSMFNTPEEWDRLRALRTLGYRVRVNIPEKV